MTPRFACLRRPPLFCGALPVTRYGLLSLRYADPRRLDQSAHPLALGRPGKIDAVHPRTGHDAPRGVRRGIRDLMTGIHERAMLYSSTEYKKVRLTYFTEELDGWERRERARAATAAVAS